MTSDLSRNRSGLIQRALIGLSILLGSFAVHAQTNSSWPRETIRIVVSFTPGGAPDTLARVLAEDWQKTLGVSILVDNRPGHGGNIGADLVAKSNPDGYTLLIGTVGIHAINGALYEKLPYDPIADFTPISFLASTPNVLIVNKQLGVQSLKELARELQSICPGNSLKIWQAFRSVIFHIKAEHNLSPIL
ncbi:MAG: hypothetical protein RL234_917 [Pseudomonadota bacterium]